MNRGATLLELATVLLLLGVALSVTLPPLSRERGRWAVDGARNAAVGMVARAREGALRAGGAELRAAAGEVRLSVEVDGDVVVSADLGREFGVELDLGGAEEAVLPFDGLGVGRAASRTFVFRRGDVAAKLTVSAYGRVKRW